MPTRLPAHSARSAPHRAGSSWFTPQMLFGLLIALVVCYGAAALGSALTFPNLEPWYARLDKPFFNPPNELFGPVWSVLYTLMAVSVWRVWGKARAEGISLSNPLGLFGMQLALNIGWSLAFFGLHSPTAGLIVILMLDAALILTIVAFRRIDRTAALLLLPYLAWILFATLLNASVWVLN